LSRCAAFRIDYQRFSALEDVEVGLNTALRIQHERIDAVSSGQIPNIVRDHAIQPADPVAAGHGDLGAPAQVVEAAPREQGLELAASIAEVRRSRCRAVLGWIRPRKCCRRHKLKL
jgi:hypothetical protein